MYSLLQSQSASALMFTVKDMTKYKQLITNLHLAIRLWSKDLKQHIPKLVYPDYRVIIYDVIASYHIKFPRGVTEVIELSSNWRTSW